MADADNGAFEFLDTFAVAFFDADMYTDNVAGAQPITMGGDAVTIPAVQIGNPIEEKKVLDVVLQARDRGLFTALTDCGAGGFSSAVGEMGQNYRRAIDLLNTEGRARLRGLVLLAVLGLRRRQTLPGR